MRKLKPCPKCGADDPMKDYLYQTAGGRTKKRWYYECRECHASTKDYRLITEAAEAWNAGEVPETRIRFTQWSRLE